MLVIGILSTQICFYYIGTKFEHDLHHVLTRATAFEAVMRVRATRGIRFSNFYGNYFIRGTDLLALPNCTSDSSFSLDMAYDENILSAQAITIQVLAGTDLKTVVLIFVIFGICISYSQRLCKLAYPIAYTALFLCMGW